MQQCKDDRDPRESLFTFKRYINSLLLKFNESSFILLNFGYQPFFAQLYIHYREAWAGMLPIGITELPEAVKREHTQDSKSRENKKQYGKRH